MKLAGVALFTAGYVIETKAGRERYAQIVDVVGRGPSDWKSSARVAPRAVGTPSSSYSRVVATGGHFACPILWAR